MIMADQWRVELTRIGNRELPANFSSEVLANLAMSGIAWISFVTGLRQIECDSSVNLHEVDLTRCETGGTLGVGVQGGR